MKSLWFYVISGRKTKCCRNNAACAAVGQTLAVLVMKVVMAAMVLIKHYSAQCQVPGQKRPVDGLPELPSLHMYV
jgi:hypothetical protein